MGDGAGFAVHHFGRAHDGRPKNLRYGLVAQANAKQGNVTRIVTDDPCTSRLFPAVTCTLSPLSSVPASRVALFPHFRPRRLQ
jgi:alpha-glucuronidase